MAKGVKVVMNKKNIQALKLKQTVALVQAVDATKKDLLISRAMPFGETGNLQNRSTYVDDSNSDKGRVSLVSDEPYARYLYFGKLMVDPETGSSWARKDSEKVLTDKDLEYWTGENAKAGSHWFETYISGVKKNFIKNAYVKRLHLLLSGGTDK